MGTCTSSNVGKDTRWRHGYVNDRNKLNFMNILYAYCSNVTLYIFMTCDKIRIYLDNEMRSISFNSCNICNSNPQQINQL